MNLFGKRLMCFIFINILVIPILCLGVYYYLNRAQRSGTIKIPKDPNSRSESPKEEIIIVYDDYGIPHISGSSLEDVYFGLGYAHALDRLWDMHFKRLFVSGRISQVSR